MINTIRRMSASLLIAGSLWAGNTGQPTTHERSVVSVQGLQHHTRKDARRLNRQGMKWYRQRLYEEALAVLLNAIELDGQSAMILNNLGVVYCALGRDAEAADAFQTSIRVDGGSVESYSNLASVEFNNFRYGSAEEAARRALRLDPLSAEATVMLALSEVAQGHWTREARRTLDEHRALCPQAERILRYWNASPGGAGVKVRVFGAGAGAMAKTAAMQAR